MGKQRIQELIARHFHGDLDETGSHELAAWLRAEAWAREEFLQSGEIHGRLLWEYGKLQDVRRETERAKRVFMRSVLALAVVLMGLLLVGSLWISSDHRPQEAKPGLAAKSLVLASARIIQEDGTLWGGSLSRAVKVGEWLLPETYQLKSGQVTLAFDGGSLVKVDAPAKFTIVNAQSIQLESGRLQAHVIESAKGFTVIAPEGKIIDLGTEFYVDVGANGLTDVGVIKGLVETVTTKDGTHRLKASHRLLLADGKQSKLNLNEIPALNEEFRFAHKVPFYHWTFDRQEQWPDGEVACPETGIHPLQGDLALREATSVKGGASPKLVQGVFGNAVEFSGNGVFLISNYRGISGSQARTIAAWVKIPSNAPPQTAYGWAGWGTHAEFDQAHKWQISWNPQIKLDDWKQPLSPGAVQGAMRTEFGPGWLIGTTDLRDGKWHHVVSIFIGGDNADVATHVRQYVDGRLEGISGYRSQIVDTWTHNPKSWPLIVGHHLAMPSDYFTGFKGDIDEIYIFEGALTPAQVWKLYKENKPPVPETIPPSLGPIATK